MRPCEREREKTQDLLKFFRNKITEKTLLCGFRVLPVCRTSTPWTYRTFEMAFQLKQFQYFKIAQFVSNQFWCFLGGALDFIYILVSDFLLANYFQGIKNRKLKTFCRSYLMKIDIHQIWCFILIISCNV